MNPLASFLVTYGWSAILLIDVILGWIPLSLGEESKSLSTWNMLYSGVQQGLQKYQGSPQDNKPRHEKRVRM